VQKNPNVLLFKINNLGTNQYHKNTCVIFMSSSSSAPTFHFLCLFLRSTGIRSQLQAHSGNGQSESDGVECLIKNQHARIGYLMHMTYGTLPVEALKSHISSRVIRTYYDHEHSCLNLISSL